MILLKFEKYEIGTNVFLKNIIYLIEIYNFSFSNLSSEFIQIIQKNEF